MTNPGQLPGSSPLTPDIVRKVLGDPSKYPKETKSWIQKIVTGNKAIQISEAQLPDLLPGGEIAYDQITANVSVTGTTSAAPTTVISGSAHTFDGEPVMVEFFSLGLLLPTPAGALMNVGLYEAGTLLTVFSQGIQGTTASAVARVPAHGRYKFTPSGGVHTYSVKAFVSSTTGSPLVLAAGTPTGGTPAFLRITKV